MSRGWQRSDLRIGDEVRINSDMLISGKSGMQNLERSVIVGESSTGLLIDCRFKPNLRAQNPEECHYRMFIAWSSIWCGFVKLYRDDSTSILANRIPGQPITCEVVKDR